MARTKQTAKKSTGPVGRGVTDLPNADPIDEPSLELEEESDEDRDSDSCLQAVGFQLLELPVTSCKLSLQGWKTQYYSDEDESGSNSSDTTSDESMDEIEAHKVGKDTPNTEPDIEDKESDDHSFPIFPTQACGEDFDVRSSSVLTSTFTKCSLTV